MGAKAKAISSAKNRKAIIAGFSSAALGRLVLVLSPPPLPASSFAILLAVHALAAGGVGAY